MRAQPSFHVALCVCVCSYAFHLSDQIIAFELTVDVIIGISVSADLSSQTSATTLFVSMSISPKTHTASLFNPLPTLYFISIVRSAVLPLYAQKGCCTF